LIYFRLQNFKERKKKVMVNDVNLYLDCKEFLCDGGNSENEIFISLICYMLIIFRGLCFVLILL
jgi:hypothetical protein